MYFVSDELRCDIWGICGVRARTSSVGSSLGRGGSEKSSPWSAGNSGSSRAGESASGSNRRSGHSPTGGVPPPPPRGGVLRSEGGSRLPRSASNLALRWRESAPKQLPSCERVCMGRASHQHPSRCRHSSCHTASSVSMTSPPTPPPGLVSFVEFGRLRRTVQLPPQSPEKLLPM